MTKPIKTDFVKVSGVLISSKTSNLTIDSVDADISTLPVGQLPDLSGIQIDVASQLWITGEGFLTEYNKIGVLNQLVNDYGGTVIGSKNFNSSGDSTTVIIGRENSGGYMYERFLIGNNNVSEAAMIIGDRNHITGGNRGHDYYLFILGRHNSGHFQVGTFDAMTIVGEGNASISGGESINVGTYINIFGKNNIFGPSQEGIVFGENNWNDNTSFRGFVFGEKNSGVRPGSNQTSFIGKRNLVTGDKAPPSASFGNIVIGNNNSVYNSPVTVIGNYIDVPDGQGLYASNAFMIVGSSGGKTTLTSYSSYASATGGWTDFAFCITGQRIFNGFLSGSGAYTGSYSRTFPRRMMIDSGCLGLGSYPSAPLDIHGSGLRIQQSVNTGISSGFASGVILWDTGYLYLATGNGLLARKQLGW